jgi:hypothetical protein
MCKKDFTFRLSVVECYWPWDSHHSHPLLPAQITVENKQFLASKSPWLPRSRKSSSSAVSTSESRTSSFPFASRLLSRLNRGFEPLENWTDGDLIVPQIPGAHSLRPWTWSSQRQQNEAPFSRKQKMEPLMESLPYIVPFPRSRSPADSTPTSSRTCPSP